MIQERLAALRSRMKEEHVDAYLVPTDDFHCSEYVGDYFKCRKYITGFTGSAGTAVITMDEVGCGVVPMSREERQYRDAAGRAGQELAGRAEQVWRVIAGIAVRIK